MGLDRYLRAARSQGARINQDIGGGVTIVATTTVHGPKQMRCGKCGGMSAPAKNRRNEDIYRCSTCGTECGMRPL